MEKIVEKDGAAAMDNGKLDRVLLLYERLRAGKVVNKAEAAGECGVTERSIQRDIDALRAFFSEQAAQRGVAAEIMYDRARKGFVLEGARDPIMTNSEILAVSKILLESRAFRREDMGALLDKLITGCVPQENMKLVSELIANERYHYVELSPPGHPGYAVGRCFRHPGPGASTAELPAAGDRSAAGGAGGGAGVHSLLRVLLLPQRLHRPVR